MGDNSEVSLPRPRYCFEEATRFSKSYKELQVQSGLDGLSKALDGYKAHMSRIEDLGATPIQLVYFAALFLSFQLKARLKAEADGVPSERRAAVVKIFQQEMFDQWRRSKPEADLDLEIIADGANSLEAMAVSAEATIPVGLEATLATMVSDAWSAFEIFAGDLWIEAVNACPSVLAKAFDSQNIRLDTLRSFDFDVSREMGRLLVEATRVEFISLNKIQAAYTSAFGAEASQVLFSPYPTLEGISQLRNCLAHRGGVADLRGLRHIQAVPGLEDVSLGDRIPFSGPIVREVINLLVTTSERLFRFTDEWLRNNADKCQRR